MTNHEVYATLVYMEASLLNLVEAVEPHIADPAVVTELYHQANQTLIDCGTALTHLCGVQQDEVANHHQ